MLRLLHSRLSLKTSSERICRLEQANPQGVLWHPLEYMLLRIPIAGTCIASREAAGGAREVLGRCY